MLEKDIADRRPAYRDYVRRTNAFVPGPRRAHERDGWRLVQIFAPSTGVYGAAKYFEIILEREIGN